MKTLVSAALAVLLAFSPVAARAEALIAVPNLDYKSEVREFFYYEAASSHDSVSNTAHVNASTAHLSAAGAYTGDSSSSYVRTFHDQVHIKYGELRGMTAEIRSKLLKSGFQILNTPPHVEKPKQTDDFFDLNKRIKAGEFGKANYVLYGVISSLDAQEGREHIVGTNTQMDIRAVNMTVDFSLVDTHSLKVAAAFSATASANDNKIGNSAVPPNVSKIIADIGKNLADDVASRLSEQGILRADATVYSSGDPAPLVQEAPVAVYRPDSN